jgi:anthranilate phosphoribosyltransferase
MVALNAGATIYAADLADSVSAGVALARDVLNSGKALDKLSELAKLTSSFKEDS